MSITSEIKVYIIIIFDILLRFHKIYIIFIDFVDSTYVTIREIAYQMSTEHTRLVWYTGKETIYKTTIMIKHEVKAQIGVTLNFDPCRNTTLGSFFYVEYWLICSGFFFIFLLKFKSHYRIWSSNIEILLYTYKWQLKIKEDIILELKAEINWGWENKLFGQKTLGDEWGIMQKQSVDKSRNELLMEPEFTGREEQILLGDESRNALDL